MIRKVLRVVVSMGLVAALFPVVSAGPAGAQVPTTCTGGVIVTVGRVAVPAGGELVDIVDTQVCVFSTVAGSPVTCMGDLVLITIEEITAAGLLVVRDVCVAVGTTIGPITVSIAFESNSPIPLPGTSGDDGYGPLSFIPPLLVVLSLLAPAAGRRLLQRRHRATAG